MIRLSGRTLGIALIVSLAVNLFLAGAIVTAMVYHKKSGWVGHGRAFPHWAARRALEPEAREKVDKVWRDARPDLKQRIQAARKARREIREILRAETLDKAKLDQAFANLRVRSAEMHSAIQAAISKIAATLNAEERRDYFKRHRWRHGKWRRKWRERHRHREGE